ncbi:MAG TPA: 4-hydroxy-tetrahydrodipicolinate reductase [Candidatus Acidoferrales bacterium]|nr:4-hydroxy-tetrahydrodipicolinate reductase [Candidatus Acidoferrales bacterium]
MVEIIVCGAAGRMGSTIVRLAQQTPEIRLAGAVEFPASPAIGRDAGEVAGAGRAGVAISGELGPLLGQDRVIIDFTQPKASLGFLRAAVESSAPMVLCTTGFDKSEVAEIERLGPQTRLVFSANMSIGVNLLLSMLGNVARTLGDDYDVEIVETHHRFKKDAPSGTALALGQVIAKALGRDLDSVAVSGRKGLVGERTKKEIALLSVRAGDVVGDHTVIFGGLGERIEFTHRAHSRENFARGALRAAEWIVHQPKGLYSMQDVLGLK